MTRIDFYILADMTRDAAMRFACRLSLKGFQSGQPVHVHTQSPADTQTLDELMWDYPKHRFLPHCAITEAESSDRVPVHISDVGPIHQSGLLINLADDVPGFFGRFDRIAEVVVQETAEQGRQRYKHYRDRGCPLHHHEMDGWEDK